MKKGIILYSSSAPLVPPNLLHPLNIIRTSPVLWTLLIDPDLYRLLSFPMTNFVSFSIAYAVPRISPSPRLCKTVRNKLGFYDTGGPPPVDLSAVTN